MALLSSSTDVETGWEAKTPKVTEQEIGSPRRPENVTFRDAVTEAIADGSTWCQVWEGETLPPSPVMRPRRPRFFATLSAFVLQPGQGYCFPHTFLAISFFALHYFSSDPSFVLVQVESPFAH